MNNTNLREKAITFFRQAYDSVNLKRKYTGVNYWTHTENVANLVSKIFKDNDNMYIAALAHDYEEEVSIKNKDYSRQKVTENFGKRVTYLMVELTDVYTHEAFPMFNREQRKKLEAARISCISNDAKNIKLCDIIDNTKDIVENDKDFAVVYLTEKWQLLKALFRGSNKRLWCLAVITFIKAKLELLQENYE